MEWGEKKLLKRIQSKDLYLAGALTRDNLR
jgi:hypothetical protein